jgi:(p)ppGpp synthase/HD superfamily hydrolase
MVHPLGVAKILIEHGCSERVVVAGILHDTVEDTRATLDDIRRLFGEDVARLVQGASEPDKSAPWPERKRHTIEGLKTAPPEVALVSVADKLDNIRSMRDDYQRIGGSLWSRFNGTMEEQRWYYESLADVFSKRDLGEPFGALAREFRSEVEAVFGASKA